MDDLSGIGLPAAEPDAETIVPDHLMPMDLQFDLLPKGIKSLVPGIALHGALSDARRSGKILETCAFTATCNLICS
jgi:hypothetical protein